MSPSSVRPLFSAQQVFGKKLAYQVVKRHSMQPRQGRFRFIEHAFPSPEMTRPPCLSSLVESAKGVGNQALKKWKNKHPWGCFPCPEGGAKYSPPPLPEIEVNEGFPEVTEASSAEVKEWARVKNGRHLILAWYNPAHHNPSINGSTDWGIFIPPEGVKFVAERLKEIDGDLPEGRYLELAAKVLFYHECGHALMEDLVSMTELHEDNDYGISFERLDCRIYRKKKGGLLNEERFCNTYAFSCIKRDCQSSPSEIMAVFKFMRNQPPGYRHFSANVYPAGGLGVKKDLAALAWYALWDYVKDAHGSIKDEQAHAAKDCVESTIEAAFGVRFSCMEQKAKKPCCHKEGMLGELQNGWPSGGVPVFFNDGSDACPKGGGEMTVAENHLCNLEGPLKGLANSFSAHAEEMRNICRKESFAIFTNNIKERLNSGSHQRPDNATDDWSLTE